MTSKGPGVSSGLCMFSNNTTAKFWSRSGGGKFSTNSRGFAVECAKCATNRIKHSLFTNSHGVGGESAEF